MKGERAPREAPPPALAALPSVPTVAPATVASAYDGPLRPLPSSPTPRSPRNERPPRILPEARRVRPVLAPPRRRARRSRSERPSAILPPMGGLLARRLCAGRRFEHGPRAVAPRAPPARAGVAPPSEPDPRARASKLRDDGNDAMIAMRYADALAAYKGALALTPGRPGLYLQRRSRRAVPRGLPAGARRARGVRRTRDARGEDEGRQARRPVRRDTPARRDARPQVLGARGARDGARQDRRGRRRSRRRAYRPARRRCRSSSTGSSPRRGTWCSRAAARSIEVQLHPRSTSSLLGIASDPVGASIAIDGTRDRDGEPARRDGPPRRTARSGRARGRLRRSEARAGALAGRDARRDGPRSKSRSVLTRWWFWSDRGGRGRGGRRPHVRADDREGRGSRVAVTRASGRAVNGAAVVGAVVVARREDVGDAVAERSRAG